MTVLSSGVPNECAYFLGLGPECVELIAPICCLQLHSLGKVLRVNQAFRKIKAGIDAALSRVDDPVIERHGALTSCPERRSQLSSGFERVLGPLINLACVSYVPLGEGGIVLGVSSSRRADTCTEKRSHDTLRLQR